MDLGLYVGNLQVMWGLLEWLWGCMLLMGFVGVDLGLCVGNPWGYRFATVRSDMYIYIYVYIYTYIYIIYIWFLAIAC